MADPNSAFYNFSQLYGSEELSDLTIVLTTAGEDAPAKPPPAKRARAAKQRTPSAADAAPAEGEEVLLPGHGLVLAGCSPVFMAQLTRWKEQAGKSSNDRPRITLHVSSAAELDAARTMIQFMYQRRLPDGAPQQQLVMMLQLADRYDVQPCAAACGAALSTLQLERDTLQQVLRLPAAYSESPLFSGLFSKVADQLQHEFGDLEVAWADDTKRERFLALPLKGVELLLDDKRTRVAYENTVFRAVSLWVHAQENSLEAAAEQQLAQLIRCPFLTPFFAATVAAASPWFVDALGVGTVAAGLCVAQAMAGSATRLKDIMSECAAHRWPKSWAKGKRPASARKELLLEWRVPLKELEAVFADKENEESRESPAGMFGGYLWNLSVQRQAGDGAGAKLGVFVVPDGAQSMELEETAEAAVVAPSCTVSCLRPGQEPHSGTLATHIPLSAQDFGGRGWVDFWHTGPMAEWDAARFAEFVDSKGQLVLQLTVKQLL